MAECGTSAHLVENLRNHEILVKIIMAYWFIVKFSWPQNVRLRLSNNVFFLPFYFFLFVSFRFVFVCIFHVRVMMKTLISMFDIFVT